MTVCGLRDDSKRSVVSLDMLVEKNSLMKGFGCQGRNPCLAMEIQNKITNPVDTCKNCAKCAKEAWNFVQMKLLPCRSRTDVGPFRKFSIFVCVPTWQFQTKEFH